MHFSLLLHRRNGRRRRRRCRPTCFFLFSWCMCRLLVGDRADRRRGRGRLVCFVLSISLRCDSCDRALHRFFFRKHARRRVRTTVVGALLTCVLFCSASTLTLGDQGRAIGEGDRMYWPARAMSGVHGAPFRGWAMAYFFEGFGPRPVGFLPAGRSLGRQIT